MQRIRKVVAVILSVLTMSGALAFGSVFSASAKGTGVGLAEWALNAYYSGWSYVYGGATPGAVDCSGLIYSYCGGERCGNPQLNTATATGSVSNGIPNIHGLGLWRPGHVGVYVGNNMEVDARGDDYGVCYESIGGYNNWTYWFKLAACSYPTTGWENFNGSYYYYENGEYITNTSRVIGGTTYYFDGSGKSSQTPSNMSATASGSSSSSKPSSSSSKPTSWKNGSTGAEVKKIQQRLQELGYYNGAIDGSFGDGTEQAFIAFQTAAGLTPDGIAGSDRNLLYSDDAPKATEPATEAATEPATEEKAKQDTEEKTEEAKEEPTEAASDFKNGDEGEKITEIQTQLGLLGYFGIDATGFYGDYTEDAVKAFQTANGLEATGIIDKATAELLFSEKAKQAPTEAETTAQPTTSVATSATEKAQNQSYTDTASNVVSQASRVADKALAQSSKAVTTAKLNETQRTANVWIWMILVSVVLGALAVVFLFLDKKDAKYKKNAKHRTRAKTKRAISADRW